MLIRNHLLWLKILFVILYLPSNTPTDSTISASPETITKRSRITERVPIELYDLGYYDGDWEKFCRRKDIYENYLYYPEHEMKKLHILLCTMVESRRFDNQTRATCAVYKYCLLMKPHIDKLLDDFIGRFSLHDENKKKDLVYNREFDETSDCYKATRTEFEKKCIAAGNPYSSMFRQIFSRACEYPLLTTDSIMSTIEELCPKEKFMADRINWIPIAATIRFNR